MTSSTYDRGLGEAARSGEFDVIAPGVTGALNRMAGGQVPDARDR